MSRTIVEKIPVLTEIIVEEYDHQVGTAISNDHAKTMAEKYLNVRLKIYNLYRMDGDPDLYINAFVSGNQTPHGYLALVADIDKNATVDVEVILYRIKEGLRDASDLQEKIAVTKELPESADKSEKIKSINAMHPKLKKLAEALPDFKLTAIQIQSETPGAISTEVMTQVEKILLENVDLRTEPTNEEIKFFVKVSSLANGNALVNVQNKEHGFERLTISRFVDGFDYCDLLYHASLEQAVFEVVLLNDQELASATTKSILIAQKIDFYFSESDVLKSILNRNKVNNKQIKLNFEAEREVQ